MMFSEKEIYFFDMETGYRIDEVIPKLLTSNVARAGDTFWYWHGDQEVIQSFEIEGAKLNQKRIDIKELKSSTKVASLLIEMLGKANQKVPGLLSKVHNWSEKDPSPLLEYQSKAFRNEFTPIVSKVFFKALLKAISLVEERLGKDSDSETLKKEYQILKEISHSYFEIETLDPELKAIHSDSEDYKQFIEKYNTWNTIKRPVKIDFDNKDAVLHQIETLSPETVEPLTMGILKRVYSHYDKAIFTSSDTVKISTVLQKAKNDLELYFLLLDKLTELICESFKSAYYNTMHALSTFEEGTKHLVEEKAKYLTVEYDYYQQYHRELCKDLYDENLYLEFFKIMISCYNACKGYIMSDDLNHMCMNTIKV